MFVFLVFRTLIHVQNILNGKGMYFLRVADGSHEVGLTYPVYVQPVAIAVATQLLYFAGLQSCCFDAFALRKAEQLYVRFCLYNFSGKYIVGWVCFFSVERIGRTGGSEVVHRAEIVICKRT